MVHLAVHLKLNAEVLGVVLNQAFHKGRVIEAGRLDGVVINRARAIPSL